MTALKKSEHLGWSDGLTIRASAALVETLSSGPITYATAKHHLICEVETICCPLLVSINTALMGVLIYPGETLYIQNKNIFLK